MPPRALRAPPQCNACTHVLVLTPPPSSDPGMVLSGMAGGVAGPVLTSWIMSLKWLVFKRTKIGFWREVVKATETYVSPPLDEYERPGDVPIIKVNRIVANPSTLKTQLVRTSMGWREGGDTLLRIT